MSKVRVYIAHKLTGRDAEEVVKESQQIKKLFPKYDIEPLDPVEVEGIQAGQGTIQASPAMLQLYWKRDKEMIRDSHILVDLTAGLYSEGVSKECGFMRYCLWRPVVRVYRQRPKPRFSIANLEDDLIVYSFKEAAFVIQKEWGTWPKRVWWRVKMLNRCLWRWLYDQLRGFK